MINIEIHFIQLTYIIFSWKNVDMHKITNTNQSRLITFNELGSKFLFYWTTLYHRRRKTPIRREVWTFTMI